LRGEKIYVSSRLQAANDFHARLQGAGVERLNTHSLAFGVLLVAEGEVVAAITGATEPYELASVKAVVEEAGGVVSDLQGNPIERCDKPIQGFIAAANERIIQQIVDLYRGDAGNGEHLAVIQRYLHGTPAILPVKSGYVNDVYIVDDAYVFRFPKSPEWRAILLFESDVLKRLEGHTALPIPTVQHVENDGSYAVFSYIPGLHRSAEEIGAMSTEAKRAFANNMAAFLVELNEAVTRDWLAVRIQGLPVERKDDARYYAELLELGRSKANPYLPQYEASHAKLLALKDDVFLSDEIVIHGDLHSGNFIFDKQDKLAGIFDFGDCMLNSVYFELRQIYQFGEDVLEMMIAALEGRFGMVSAPAVRQLAVTHEFSILMRLGSKEETPYDNDRAAIAKRLLAGWGEL
jgi:aminoglycoside 2''-phosphotransferase